MEIEATDTNIGGGSMESLSQTRPSSNRKNTAQSKSAHSCRVALIEDDPIWQFQIREHLSKLAHNIDVTVLSSASEFHNRGVHPHDYDLIISDLFLGAGETGLHIWRGLQHRKCAVPFVLISGLSKSHLSGVAGTDGEMPIYIEKPYRFQDFKAQIDSMLEVPIHVEPIETVEINDFYTVTRNRNWLGRIIFLVGTLTIPLSFPLEDWKKVPTISPPPIERPRNIRAIPGSPTEDLDPKVVQYEMRFQRLHVTQETKDQVKRILARADEIKRMREQQ
jgi:FixJ family two-component response regulator